MTKSAYADRETVGTLALLARSSGERVVAGDMGHEMMPQLVDDLNEAITSNPFDGRPFYIIVHEKKDLLLNNMLCRRMVKQEYRPYPEPNTTVFWADGKCLETLFCWSLPQKEHFLQYIHNAGKYNKEQIKDILAYNMERMENFGFYKAGNTDEGVAIYHPIPGFKDRPMKGIHKHGYKRFQS
jgi:hypothetical protein